MARRAIAFPSRISWVWGLFAVYVTAACMVALVEHNVMTDAWSRVGSASYVLFSRDPHLAAIGFVWGPLPPLLLLPVVALKSLWPALVQDGLAASLLSAACMAGVVAQVHAILRDLDVPRVPRTLLTLSFAIDPMIILYGANGMTEALFLFLLLVATRQLLRFLATGTDASLVGTALALGAAYLVRYETLAAGFAVVGLVVARSFVQGRALADRRSRALADGMIVGFPLAAAFVIWAAVSWMIVGSPFEQFTSIYGTSSQIAIGADGLRAATGQGTVDAFRYVSVEILGLQPFIVPIIIAAAVVAIRGADVRATALLAVFGSVLAFAAVAFLAGKTIGSLRYFIAAIPLTVLLAGLLLGARPRRKNTRIHIRWRRLAETAVVLASVASILLSVGVMADPAIGREEWYPTQSALHPGVPPVESLEVRQYRIGHAVAAYVDSLGLPDGSVLIDVFTGFPIVLQSERPRQFVITADRDFQAVLSDPDAFGVRYLLVPPSNALNTLDALARHYPNIYQIGPSDGELIGEFGDATGTGWRLFATATGRAASRRAGP